MAYYAKIDQTGVCYAELETSNVISAQDMIVTEGFGKLGKKWNAGVWEDISVQETTKWISGVEFLRRFTSQQRIAIRNLAKTDVVAEDFLFLLDAIIKQEGKINLLDVDTIFGVNYLASALPTEGILANVILA